MVQNLVSWQYHCVHKERDKPLWLRAERRQGLSLSLSRDRERVVSSDTYLGTAIPVVIHTSCCGSQENVLSAKKKKEEIGLKYCKGRSENEVTVMVNSPFIGQLILK